VSYLIGVSPCSSYALISRQPTHYNSRMPRSAWIVLGVAAIAFFAGLDRAAISDADEAYYAEAAREMIEGGDYLTPHYNYENRFQKPVLFYWAVAAAYAVGGVGAATARIPSALSGVGIAVIAWYLGRRWYGERTGLIAGLIVSTSFGCVAMARQSLPDLPLAFFITASIASGCVALFDAGRLKLKPLLLAAAAAGLGFLTKGPVGVVLPLVVLTPIALLDRRGALRPGPIVLAGLVFAAVALPWYCGMTMVHGTAYLRSFFLTDNLERFATSRFNYPRPAWFYVPIVLGGLLPWTAFAPLWIPGVVRFFREKAMPSRATLWLIAWALFPLLLFSVSIGKQPRYVLPILPPVALLLAAALDSRLASHGRQARLLGVCGVAAGAVVVAVGLVLVTVPAEALGLDRAVLQVAGTATAIAGGVAMVAAVWRRDWIPATVTIAGLVQMVALQFSLFSMPGSDVVEKVAAEIRQRLGRETSWTTHDIFVRNLVFYVAHRESGSFESDAELVAFLRGAPALAVMTLGEYERLAPKVGAPLYELGRWRFFNASSIRIGTLVDRNPQRELRTVLLVSNRPPESRSSP
jgi:4-amino-4-deoxy-L-arabinose transferase-like glycosyltransferase